MLLRRGGAVGGNKQQLLSVATRMLCSLAFVGVVVPVVFAATVFVSQCLAAEASFCPIRVL
eukprot:SAG31_NODE_565_length_14056_cov_22.573189_9_plen_61_part_00